MVLPAFAHRHLPAPPDRQGQIGTFAEERGNRRLLSELGAATPAPADDDQDGDELEPVGNTPIADTTE